MITSLRFGLGEYPTIHKGRAKLDRESKELHTDLGVVTLKVEIIYLSPEQQSKQDMDSQLNYEAEL